MIVDETAELGAAILRRVIRVGLFAFLVGSLAVVLPLWQNFLIRDQNAKIQKQIEQQASDTLIVRRAQLLATIYEEECEDSASQENSAPSKTVPPASEVSASDNEVSAEEDRAAENGTTEMSIDERVVAVTSVGGWSGNVLNLRRTTTTGKLCSPKADPRTRREAVLAFVRTERHQGAIVDLSKANLRGLDLSEADLSQAILVEANLSQANLRGANLSGANLSGANLSGANLLIADLSGASLGPSGIQYFSPIASLHGAFLRETNLSGAVLWRADLDEADLLETDLRDAALQEASFRGAEFVEVKLARANLQGANLIGSSFSMVDLHETLHLTPALLTETCGDETTQLPEEFERPESWPCNYRFIDNPPAPYE